MITDLEPKNGGKEDEKDSSVDIFSEDITWVKLKVSTKEEHSTDARKLLLALIYICRKCNTDTIVLYQSQNNRLNRTSLCKLVKIDRKHLDSILSMFQEKKIVNLSLDNKKHLCITMNKVPENRSKILRKDVKYQKLYSLANDKFREKVTKNVKNNCAQ